MMTDNNETPFERRDRLSDTLLELSNLAFEQGDIDEGGRHLAHALRLFLINLNAIELEHPGFARRLYKESSEWKYIFDLLNGNK